jgi:hypothetical protein
LGKKCRIRFNQKSSSSDEKDLVIGGLQEPIKSFNPIDSDLESSVQLPEIVVPVLPAVAVVASKTVKGGQRKGAPKQGTKEAALEGELLRQSRGLRRLLREATSLRIA